MAQPNKYFEFYRNSEIFITGGSGVVGKSLIEKLLRSCNVGRIHILLRPKRGVNIVDRLEQIRNAKIFRRLRAENPDELNKLVAIPGDCLLPNLGITPEYAKRLENVSMIFHCAATVRFDEPMKVALRLNVLGTLRVLEMALTLKNLKIFMHISTFFSNPYLKYVDEKIYPSPMDWRVCLKLLQVDADDELIDTMTRKLITGFPNTYTFTKNIAENMVNDFRDRLPVAICRPSVVLSAAFEPEPGFPTNLTGATGMLALVTLGIAKTVFFGKNFCLDITPQDSGTILTLGYAAHAAFEYSKRFSMDPNVRSPRQDIPVYMLSSSKLVTYTFEFCCNTLVECSYDYPILKSFLLPGVTVTSSRFLYMFLVFTLHLPPALLADMLLRLLGRQPAVLSIIRKLFVANDVMKAFIFNYYDSPGYSQPPGMIDALIGTQLDITEHLKANNIEGGVKFIRSIVPQVRENLLHETPEMEPLARKILTAKIWTWNVIRAVLGYYTLRWTYRTALGYYNSLTEDPATIL